MIKLGLSLIANRYAKALFSLAKEQKALDAVAADIHTLSGYYAKSDIFQDLAQNKMFSRNQQAKILENLVDTLGLHALVKQTAGVLAENRRLAIVPELAQAFEILLLKEKNIVPVTVVSSVPVDAQQTQTIVAMLEKSLEHKVSAIWETDPSILGGLMVKIGSMLYDCSLAGKLQRIEALSQEVIAA